MKFLLLCALLPAVLGCGSKMSHFNLQNWKHVRVTATEAQVPVLEQIRNSNTRAMFLTGIGKSGGLTEILVSPDALDGVVQTLKASNVEFVIYATKVNIAMDNIVDKDAGNDKDKEKNAVAKFPVETLDINLSARQNLIPVQQIEGTNLHTGIFYKLGMKRYPSALWAEN